MLQTRQRVVLLHAHTVNPVNPVIFPLLYYWWVNKVQQIITKSWSRSPTKRDDTTSYQNYKVTTLPTISGYPSLATSTTWAPSSKRTDIFLKLNLSFKLQDQTSRIGSMRRLKALEPLSTKKVKKKYTFLRVNISMLICRKMLWLSLGGKTNNSA